MKHFETDTMARAYAECALWSSLDYSRGDDNENPPLDANYTIWDIPAQTREEIVSDCTEFVTDNEKAIETVLEAGYDYENIGHSFWLDREGHGAGFSDYWDASNPTLNEALKRLQEAAKVYGNYSDTLNDALA